LSTDINFVEISSDDSDEDKYADDVDVVGQNVDTKERVTVRNLRIREDTAKYLINLDPNSANYDPKTRSMRENPHVGKNLKTLPLYRGDDFERYTGDVCEVIIHLNSLPK
jgi:pre-mRNA-processing factor SLU7